MQAKVLKFGGTSVANASCLRQATAIIAQEVEAQTTGTVVVVSALAGITDLLLDMADDAVAGRPYAAKLADVWQRHRLTAEQSTGFPSLLATLSTAFAGLERDLRCVAQGDNSARVAVCAWGERLAALLLAAAAQSAGVRVTAVSEELIVTDAPPYFCVEIGAEPLLAATRRNVQAMLLPLLEQGIVPIIPGFIARSVSGEQTLLGRGGSDWTATLIAAALEPCAGVTIYTDVPGVWTADPRVVPDAQPLPHLSYEEATRLAWYGAKVLHPRALDPVAHGIPVHVKSTFAPGAPGTVIGPSEWHHGHASALALKQHLALLTVPLAHAAASFATIVRAGIVPLTLCSGNQFVVEEQVTSTLVALLGQEPGIDRLDCRTGLAACTYLGSTVHADLVHLTAALAAETPLVAASIAESSMTLLVHAEHGERVLRDLHATLIPVTVSALV